MYRKIVQLAIDKHDSGTETLHQGGKNTSEPETFDPQALGTKPERK